MAGKFKSIVDNTYYHGDIPAKLAKEAVSKGKNCDRSKKIIKATLEGGIGLGGLLELDRTAVCSLSTPGADESFQDVEKLCVAAASHGIQTAIWAIRAAYCSRDVDHTFLRYHWLMEDSRLRHVVSFLRDIGR